MHGRRACVAGGMRGGGYAWQGGMHGRMCVWVGAGGTHPTRTHSC